MPNLLSERIVRIVGYITILVLAGAVLCIDRKFRLCTVFGVAEELGDIGH